MSAQYTPNLSTVLSWGETATTSRKRKRFPEELVLDWKPGDTGRAFLLKVRDDRISVILRK